MKVLDNRPSSIFILGFRILIIRLIVIFRLLFILVDFGRITTCFWLFGNNHDGTMILSPPLHDLHVLLLCLLTLRACSSTVKVPGTRGLLHGWRCLQLDAYSDRRLQRHTDVIFLPACCEINVFTPLVQFAMIVSKTDKQIATPEGKLCPKFTEKL